MVAENCYSKKLHHTISLGFSTNRYLVVIELLDFREITYRQRTKFILHKTLPKQVPNNSGNTNKVVG